MRVFISLLVFWGCAPALANPTINDFSFLQGHWRGGDENFVFEEIWSEPGGSVMTAMARGVAGDAVRILEYVIISEEPDGIVMRFKHFNPDYSVWEGEEDAPLTLQLASLEGADALFVSDPPTHTVKSIRYWMPDADTLQVDVAQVENGEDGGFTLVFYRVD